MKSYKPRSLSRSGCSKSKRTSYDFTGDLALGLWAATPQAKDPVDSILQHARALVREAGLSGPPYRPSSYAPLCKVMRISYEPMEIDGRLIPIEGGFIVELRRGSSAGRENFTLAHEIAHTFFFEVVPWIKYRNLNSAHSQDDEEELLCNIAAGELLMPLQSITEVVGDYAPSPTSLQQIAELYETSLTATVVRLTSMNVWNAKFILWEATGERLKALWFAQQGRKLYHFPRIDIENHEFSSIRNAFITGESTEGEEWLCFDRRFKFCRVSSIRLANSRVLTSIVTSSKSSALIKRCQPASVSLPVEYDCGCNGTGTRIVERDGLTYGTRCLASHHGESHLETYSSSSQNIPGNDYPQ